jgi:hypothetical protein
VVARGGNVPVVSGFRQLLGSATEIQLASGPIIHGNSIYRLNFATLNEHQLDLESKLPHLAQACLIGRRRRSLMAKKESY